MGGAQDLGIVGWSTHSAEKDLPKGPEKVTPPRRPPTLPTPRMEVPFVGAKGVRSKGESEMHESLGLPEQVKDFLIMFSWETPRQNRGAPGALKII